MSPDYTPTPDGQAVDMYGGPARRLAISIVKYLEETLPADVMEMVRRQMLWDSGLHEIAGNWDIDARDIAIVQRWNGRRRYLAELDIQEMWPMVLSYSTHERARWSATGVTP